MPQTFRTSRIFAEGWNAARTSLAAKSGEMVNPYPPGPEHNRWNEGYNQAQGTPR